MKLIYMEQTLQLIAKTQGVEVKVTLPSGTKEYEIEDVYYKEF